MLWLVELRPVLGALPCDVGQPGRDPAMAAVAVAAGGDLQLDYRTAVRLADVKKAVDTPEPDFRPS